MNIKIGAIYKHYKGHKYKVVAIGKDSETLEELVVYQGQYTDPKFGKNPVWVRPIKEFLEEIERDGKKFSRFKFIKEE